MSKQISYNLVINSIHRIQDKFPESMTTKLICRHLLLDIKSEVAKDDLIELGAVVPGLISYDLVIDCINSIQQMNPLSKAHEDICQLISSEICEAVANDESTSIGEVYQDGTVLEEEMDKGPWVVNVTEKGVRLQSDDFNHDVHLEISGDFPDIAAKRQYAYQLANKLNSR